MDEGRQRQACMTHVVIVHTDFGSHDRNIHVICFACEALFRVHVMTVREERLPYQCGRGRGVQREAGKDEKGAACECCFISVTISSL